MVLASVAIAATAAAMKGQLGGFHDTVGFLGTAISALFLLGIGLANMFVLKAVWAAFKAARSGETIAGEDLDALLAGRGFLARIVRPLSRMVSHSWQMYPIGFLFGLGFDTATEISLFVIGGSAALTAPWYVVLVLPILFTAGMTLFDTLDGVLMNRVYEWAHARPARRLYYNFTVTLLSITAAFLVGGIGLLGLLAQTLHSRSGVLAWVAGIDLQNFGLVIVAIFLTTWLAAFAYWRWRRADL